MLGRGRGGWERAGRDGTRVQLRIFARRIADHRVGPDAAGLVRLHPVLPPAIHVTLLDDAGWVGGDGLQPRLDRGLGLADELVLHAAHRPPRLHLDRGRARRDPSHRPRVDRAGGQTPVRLVDDDQARGPVRRRLRCVAAVGGGAKAVRRGRGRRGVGGRSGGRRQQEEREAGPQRHSQCAGGAGGVPSSPCAPGASPVRVTAWELWPFRSCSATPPPWRRRPAGRVPRVDVVASCVAISAPKRGEERNRQKPFTTHSPRRLRQEEEGDEQRHPAHPLEGVLRHGEHLEPAVVPSLRAARGGEPRAGILGVLAVD